MTSRRGRRSVAARVAIAALFMMPRHERHALRALPLQSSSLQSASRQSFQCRRLRTDGYGRDQASLPRRIDRRANAEEFDQLFQQVKNWGRWGADDQLGTVNLITAAKRKQALSLARTGQTVSLVHNPCPTRQKTTPARSSTR